MVAMHARRVVVLLPLALSLCACGLAIHRTPPASLLVPGRRVRVWVRAWDEYERPATLVALIGDSIVLEQGPVRTASAEPSRAMVRTTLPLGAVDKLKVSRGLHRHLAAGVALGLVAGGVVGFFACEPESDMSIRFRHPERFTYVVMPAVVLGTALGLRRAERWQDVSPDELRGVRVGLAPLPAGRLGLGAAVSF
jgi:hypothetical protein